MANTYSCTYTFHALGDSKGLQTLYKWLTSVEKYHSVLDQLSLNEPEHDLIIELLELEDVNNDSSFTSFSACMCSNSTEHEAIWEEIFSRLDIHDVTYTLMISEPGMDYFEIFDEHSQDYSGEYYYIEIYGVFIAFSGDGLPRDMAIAKIKKYISVILSQYKIPESHLRIKAIDEQENLGDYCSSVNAFFQEQIPNAQCYIAAHKYNQYTEER